MPMYLLLCFLCGVEWDLIYYKFQNIIDVMKYSSLRFPFFLVECFNHLQH